MALEPIVHDTVSKVHRHALSTEAVVSSNTPENYTSAALPPATPVVGDRWRNTDAGVVSGVPSGVTATWNGTTWDFVSPPPLVINPGSVV